MKTKRINYKELQIGREILPMLKIRLKNKFFKNNIINKKVLVINTCIIGDFLATLPALSSFIKINKLKVDMIVSHSVKPLAESIKGVNNVFVARSSYNRETEKQETEKQNISEEYGLLVVLRIGPEAYKLIKNVRFSEIINCDIVYFKYILHLVKNILTRKPVKQSKDLVFEILNLKKSDKEIKFNDIFEFSKYDYDLVKKIPEMNGNKKKIIIHLGSGWKEKQWENKKWADLLKKINSFGKFKFIFVGADEEEKESFEYIQKKLDFKIFSLIKKINLKELFLVMRLSNYFIGIDSGPRNLAHYSDLRSITLLGPGLKNFMPLNEKDIVIDKSNPFSTSVFYIGKKSGMEKIGVDEVMESFKKLSSNN
jgi:ADP-heptose:LPS heptosyltransferase